MYTIGNMGGGGGLQIYRIGRLDGRPMTLHHRNVSKIKIQS